MEDRLRLPFWGSFFIISLIIEIVLTVILTGGTVTVPLIIEKLEEAILESITGKPINLDLLKNLQKKFEDLGVLYFIMMNLLNILSLEKKLKE